MTSIKHSERSIWPTSSRCCASASSVRRSTPLLTQRGSRRKHVVPKGNRSDKSHQAAPVRSTQRMPFMTARLLCSSGRPRPSSRLGVSGINGSRIAHCSSVSSSLRAIRRSQGFDMSLSNGQVTHPHSDRRSRQFQLAAKPYLERPAIRLWFRTCRAASFLAIASEPASKHHGQRRPIIHLAPSR